MLAGRPEPGPAVGQRASVSGAERSACYEIRVEGVLDRLWTGWFEGLQIGTDGSQTVISGPVADQAALHGLLNRVFDLGLILVSVRRSGPALSTTASPHGATMDRTRRHTLVTVRGHARGDEPPGGTRQPA